MCERSVQIPKFLVTVKYLGLVHQKSPFLFKPVWKRHIGCNWVNSSGTCVFPGIVTAQRAHVLLIVILPSEQTKGARMYLTCVCVCVCVCLCVHVCVCVHKREKEREREIDEWLWLALGEWLHATWAVASSHENYISLHWTCKPPPKKNNNWKQTASCNFCDNSGTLLS